MKNILYFCLMERDNFILTIASIADEKDFLNSDLNFDQVPQAYRKTFIVLMEHDLKIKESYDLLCKIISSLPPIT